jgi:hypothetical protein
LDKIPKTRRISAARFWWREKGRRIMKKYSITTAEADCFFF